MELVLRLCLYFVLGVVVTSAITSIIGPLILLTGMNAAGATSVSGGFGTLAGVFTFIYLMRK